MNEYYKFYLHDDNFIYGFHIADATNHDFYGDINTYPDIAEGWYKLQDGQIVLDENKKAEIIAEREAETMKPTWEETIESQVYYTALMTDTWVEEEE